MRGTNTLASVKTTQHPSALNPQRKLFLKNSIKSRHCLFRAGIKINIPSRVKGGRGEISRD
jgi:hypothetical protein